MTLLEILISRKVDVPRTAQFIVQESNGTIYANLVPDARLVHRDGYWCAEDDSHDILGMHWTNLGAARVAEDYATKVVTRAEYEAHKVRLSFDAFKGLQL